MARWPYEGRQGIVQHLGGLLYGPNVVVGGQVVNGEGHQSVEMAHAQVAVGIFLQLCRRVDEV